MIALDAINAAVVQGLKAYTGVEEVIEADQEGPKPKYPYIVFKWISIIAERGTLRKTVEAVPSSDPKWDKDIKYRYVRNPVMTLSVTVIDHGLSHQTGVLALKAHEWFRIPELASDALAPTGTVILNTHMIIPRDTVLDREIERRQGFDVRMQTADVVEIIVPTIESVVINGKEFELKKE